MAQSYRSRVNSARKKYEKIIQMIYLHNVDNWNRPFSECLKLAPEDLKNKFYNAQQDLLSAESDAVSAGKAWRASFGVLTWY
jgi:hypothetical protein